MKNNRDRVCTWCGVAYPTWKVGITFADTRRQFPRHGSERDDGRGRHWITRRTVLGRMHEIKASLWFEYHGPGRCEPAALGRAGDPLAQLPALPF